MRSAAAVLAALALCTLVACGGSSPARSPASAPVSARASSAGGGAPDATAQEGLPSLDALAARGPADAPLMREALRTASAAPRSADVRAERDLCLRAFFAASVPVRASFADESGATRGDAAVGTSGTVPPRGPVCAKKGEALHLVLEATEAGPVPSARAVIFAAP